MINGNFGIYLLKKIWILLIFILLVKKLTEDYLKIIIFPLISHLLYINLDINNNQDGSFHSYPDNPVLHPVKCSIKVQTLHGALDNLWSFLYRWAVLSKCDHPWKPWFNYSVRLSSLKILFSLYLPLFERINPDIEWWQINPNSGRIRQCFLGRRPVSFGRMEFAYHTF